MPHEEIFKATLVLRQIDQYNAAARVEMSACTGRSEMPAPAPVGIDQPERHGSISSPGQVGPT